MIDYISMAHLSDLIGLIYDCALTPSAWPIAMEAIRCELDCELSSMNLQLLPGGESVVNVTTNLAPHYVEIMARSGADVVEQWGGEEIIRTLPLDRPAILSQVNPVFDVTTTQNRYYIEFAKPQGLIDVLTIGLARDDKAVGSLSFGRHQRAGPFGEREMAVARLILPHVQRAATINRLLDHAEAERDTFSATIDALARPVVLVGANLAILHVNAAAQQMLADAQIAVRESGRLRVHAPGATRALATAVAATTNASATFGRKGLGIPLRGPAGPIGSAYVLPVGRDATRATDAPCAAIFFTELTTAFIPPDELAASLFDLTSSEVRVFKQLAAGRSIAETAAILGVATSTAKTHMLRLHAKLGVTRRAELVRIAAAMVLPIIV